MDPLSLFDRSDAGDDSSVAFADLLSRQLLIRLSFGQIASAHPANACFSACRFLNTICRGFECIQFAIVRQIWRDSARSS
jgi:hypothetical protein